MAQAQPDTEIKGAEENIVLNQDNNNNKNRQKNKNKDNKSWSSKPGDGFKFNAHAPEFVPRVTPALPVSGYFVPCPGQGGGTGRWIFIMDKDYIPLLANVNNVNNNNNNVAITTSQSQSTENNDVILTEQVRNKIIKQVEYQFSDMSLLANDTLLKQIHKDPEGFVPIAIVSATKKLKSITASNYSLFAEALRTSTKLDVSSDGKRVKRKTPFTEKEKEELQLRTAVAENLPDDHSHQNLEKVFNVAGVVKTIRVCFPQEASSRGKGDHVVRTKLYALVEFENREAAEKTVEKLNERNSWKRLRVRMLVRRTPESVLESRKGSFDGYLDDAEEGYRVEEGLEDNSNIQIAVDNNASVDETGTPSKKVMWSKGRGKPQQQQRSSTYYGRGLHCQSSLPMNFELSPKQTIKGPKMPDGTKGFNMGRGRRITIPV